MRIISCHIENFGALSDFDYNFDSDISVIYEENGWGKSTLCAFIKAMFYGLAGANKRSIDDNERKRYKPWNGKVYGGTLTFEVHKKKYVLTRTFRDKEADDTFELRDYETNLISNDFTDKLGEEIFRIDRESFVRTVFIGQDEIETKATDDINAKMGNLTDNTNDLNSFEASVERLDKILNSLTPRRATGSISKRAGIIDELKRKTIQESNISSVLDSNIEALKKQSEKYDELLSEQAGLNRMQERVSKATALMGERKNLDRLNLILKQKEEALRALLDRFPKNDIPSEGEIRKTKEELNEYIKAKERVNAFKIDIPSEDVYVKNKLHFKDRELTEDDLRMINDLTDDYLNAKAILDKDQVSDSERAYFNKLDDEFKNEDIKPAQVAASWSERKTKEGALPGKEATLNAVKMSFLSTARKPGGLVCALLGIVMALAGACIALKPSMFRLPDEGYLKYILLAVGLLWTLIFFAMYLKKPSPKKLPEEITALENDIASDKSFIEKTDAEVDEYLIRHNAFFDKKDASYELQVLVRDYAEYIELKEKIKKDNELKKTADIDSLSERIKEFYRSYDFAYDAADPRKSLYELRENHNAYMSIKSKKESLDKASSELTGHEEILRGILNKYDYINEASSSVQDAAESFIGEAEELLNAKSFVDTAKAELEEFKDSVDIDELMKNSPDEELPDLNSLSQRMSSLTEEINRTHSLMLDYSNTIESLQERYDEWEEDKTALSKLNELQEEEKEKFKYVSLTKEYLTRAKDSMTARYSAPLLRRFKEYFESIAHKDAAPFRIDANTNITIFSEGLQRELNSLSRGLRDLIGICMRVALIDVMYVNERPIIVMDDPFTNLDDEKIKEGMDFLKKLSLKYQVIYFTCSKSRKIGGI